MSETELRKLWREYQNNINLFPAIREKWIQEYMQTKQLLPMPHSPELPPELIGLICGANTRAGTPCKRKDLHINGRCKLHGGLSTGPKTEQGKKWSSMNGKRPKISKPHEGRR